jgi:hypothetical protein
MEPERKEVRGRWGKLHNEELHNVHSDDMGGYRYNILVRKHGRKGGTSWGMQA